MTGRRGAACVMAAGAMVVSMATSEPIAAQGGGAGRVAGVVTLTASAAAPSPASAYSRRSVGANARALPEARSVVVYFADIVALADLKAMRTEVAQRDEQFVPHVVAVTAGSTVEFPNQDLFFHNVFSLSRSATFDLGRYPSGSSRSRLFPKPGIVKIYCHIHSQMSAVVRVFEHPWFTIPDEGGAFVIDGVPPGEHTLVAWHERIGERRDRVLIRSGATSNVTFTLPVLEPGS